MLRASRETRHRVEHASGGKGGTPVSGHGLFQRRAGAWQVAKRAMGAFDADCTLPCVGRDEYKDLRDASAGLTKGREHGGTLDSIAVRT